MSGGKGGKQTSTVSIPPEILARYRSVNDNAERVASTPFQQYSTNADAFVAPLNATQQSGIANTNAASGQAQPYYGAATDALTQADSVIRPYYGAATQATVGAYQGAQPYQQAATGLAAAGSAPINYSDLNVGSYLSPYLSTVLGSTANLLDQNNQQQQAGQLGTAIKSGAFGGDRAGIAAANLAQQQNLANANIYSGIADKGYVNALGAAQSQANANRGALFTGSNALAGIGQQGFGQGQTTSQQLAALGQGIYGAGANTATTLAGLGSGAQAAALQGAGAQLTAGQAQQQTDQAGKTALYNQFLQQQSYPFQTAQFLSNIAMGTGSLSGNTTTTNTVQNGIFSDRRLKHDIKPIGKTFDGQTIYSYRYKGEKQTEMGLIAQEVEKKHPEAVGLAGGFKTVNYDHATKHAAAKGHFASGGLVGANDNREAFYSGGMAVGLGGGGFDPSALSQMYANYQAMYGPLLSHSSGGPGATGGIVPSATLPVGQLHPARAPQMQQQDLASTITQDANAATALGKLGDKVGLWNFGGDEDSDAKPKSAEPVFGSESDKLRYGDFAGGGVIPYQNVEINGLDIPEETQRYTLMKPDTPKQDNGGGLGSLLGAAGSIAGLVTAFSDRRLKHDIKPVGETFDGQTVYSFKYKGDDTPRMGLMAQEVEKKHPHAVGHIKTVDYAKATRDAAKRGKFASGGSTIYDGIKTATKPFGKYNSVADVLAHEAAAPVAPSVDDTVSSDDVRQVAEAPDDTKVPEDKMSGDKVTSASPINVADAKPVNVPAPVGSVKDLISHTASLIAKAEGTARNPKSSAIGPYQFLNGTFREYAAKVDPGLAKTIAGMSNSELTAYRAARPELASVQKEMGLRLTADNAEALSAAKLPVTPGNLYLAHVVGTAGAKKVLAADPSTPLSKLLPKSTTDNNPLGTTAGEAVNWAGSRIERAGGAKKRAAGGRTGYADGSAVMPEAEDTSRDDKIRKIIDSIKPENPGAPIMAAPPVAEGITTNATPAALPSQGLSPAPAPSTPEQSVATPGAPTHRGFFKGLGHGDASSWIPLLSGIGALATTQTNNPLTAIAAGLGAGAQAAQGQNEFGLSRQHIANETLTAQTAAAQNRAGIVAKLVQAKGEAIGNAAKMADYAKMLYNYRLSGQIDDDTFNRLRGPADVPSYESIVGGAPYAPPPVPPAGGLAPQAAPSAAPTGGLSLQVPPATDTGLTSNLFPSLANVKRPEIAEPKGVLPTPYDALNSTGAGYGKQFYNGPGSTDWKAYSENTQRADGIATMLTKNPMLANTDYGVGLARTAEQLRAQAAIHKQNAEKQFETLVAPRIAEATQAVQHATEFTAPGGVYDRVGNTTKTITDALAQAPLQVDSPLYAQTVGRLATAFPGLVPDSFKVAQGAAEIAEQNKTLLNIFGVKGTGAAARSEATELAALNRTHGQGPAAVFDFSVKAQALADRQAAYARALIANANTLATPVGQFQQQWLAKHPLDKYLTNVVQHTPLAKGMTPQQAAAYLPPARTQAELNAQIASGARYVNVNGHRIVEVRRSGKGTPTLVEWTGK